MGAGELPVCLREEVNAHEIAERYTGGQNDALPGCDGYQGHEAKTQGIWPL